MGARGQVLSVGLARCQIGEPVGQGGERLPATRACLAPLPSSKGFPVNWRGLHGADTTNAPPGLAVTRVRGGLPYTEHVTS